MKTIRDMSMSDIRNKYRCVLDFIYNNVEDGDIDEKIRRLKNNSGITDVHCYGGNETKEEILAILEYTVIMEKLS